MDAEHFVVADGSGESESPAIQASLIVTLEGATSGSDSGHNFEEGDSNMVPVQFVLEDDEGQQPSTETQDDEADPSKVTPVEAEYVDEGNLQYENAEGVDLSEQKDTQVESLLSAVPFPHQSILRSGNEIPVLDLSEEVFHCALCPESYPAWGSKEEAAEHFKTGHWEAKLVIDEDVNAALCCCSSHNVPHYHCPYCGGVQEAVGEMTEHVAACIHTVLSQQDDAPPPAEPTAEPTPDKPPDSSPTKKAAGKQHKSLVSALSDVRLKVCRRCCRGTRYHCPFCPDVLCKPQSVNKIKHHLVTNHWKFRVPYEDMFILKCTSACLGAVNGRPVGAHWHCPICARLVSTRQVMKSHLNSHLRGTAQRRRTNAEWATLMGPEHANLLFSSKKKGDERAVERLMNTALEGNDQVFTPRETHTEQGEPKQVFQTVAALLTRDMLAAIPGSVSAYFSTLQDTADSNLQFSTSDQWCLLQADWRTMSGVHEQLTGLLSRSGTNEWMSLVKYKQDVIPDVGAGGDGFMNQEMPDVPESGNAQTEDAPIGEDGDQALDSIGGSETYLHTDPQNDTDVPGETVFPEPTSVTSENNTTQGKGYSILVAELQGITPENNSLSVPESGTGAEKEEEGAESPVGDTKTIHQIDSSIPGETEKTYDSQNEQSSTSLESTSIPNQPVKRGRGRPRKVPQSTIEPIVIQPIEPVVMKREDSPELGLRRRRSKLPKRYLDYDTFIIDVPEDVREKPESVAGPVVGPVPPVKRGRGRPPKHPKPLQPLTSKDDVEWTVSSLSKRAHTTAVKASVHKVEDSESSDEDTADGKSGKGMGGSPLRKRQKISSSDPPAITIAIDETTGNVISVAVTGDDATTEADKIKKEQETNENQVPDEMDIEDICLSNGISLVRPKKFVICESCNKNFPDNHRFYQHILGSSCLEKRMKRDKNFKPSLELDLIIREVEREVTEPKCPLCQREFKFLLHAKMHYAEKTCMKNSKQDIDTLDKNEDTGLYHCRHCSFKHEGMRRVMEHEMRKHWKKTEQCPICKKKYSCQNFLREHIKAVHAKGKERAVCDQCGVEVTARLLRQHIKFNHDPTYVRPKPKPITEPIECRDCDFKTMSYSKLARHRSNKHREQDKQCPHCEQKFAMTGDLNRHVRAVHLGQNQMSANCPQCGKTMAKKNIAAHIRMVHEKRRPHSCYLCGRAFLTSHTLRMHMGTHQPAEQKDTRYLCAFCGKGFSHRTHYQDHLNTHTGARPYTCDVCHKTFRCNPALHKHKELHRTINLHCDICSLHFPNRKALRIHNNKEHLNSTAMCRCVCDAEYNSHETLAQHQAVCGQWQQANPQDNPHVNHTSSLQNQMAVILQQAAAGGDVDQPTSSTYIVLEGQEGEETVMVLQSIDGVEGASVMQTITSSDIMTVTHPSNDDDEGTESEVLLSPEDALTMAANQADMTISMDAENPGLLTLQQDVDQQQALPVAEGEEGDEQQEVGDMNRYLCGYCQKLFTSLDDVQTHMVAEHVAAEGGEVELALHNPADDADTGMDEVTQDNLM